MDRDVVMFFFTEAASFALGVFFGVLWFRLVALPISYRMPRAIWWALRGHLRWRIVPLSLVSPLVWSALSTLAAYLLLCLAPSLIENLSSSFLFFLGLWLGVSTSGFRTVASRSGRRGLHDGFLDFVKSHVKPQEPAKGEQWGEDVYKLVWQLLRDGKRYGPFTYEDLLRLSVRGEMQLSDLLWRPGLIGWASASSVFDESQASGLSSTHNMTMWVRAEPLYGDISGTSVRDHSGF